MNKILDAVVIVASLISSSFAYQGLNYCYQKLNTNFYPFFDLEEAWKRGFFMAVGGLAVLVFYK